jgi:hypothetical protein
LYDILLTAAAISCCVTEEGRVPAPIFSGGIIERSPDERSEIRERPAGLNADPGFRCAYPGYFAEVKRESSHPPMKEWI